METKLCSKCKLILSLDKFYWESKHRYRHICKKCWGEQTKAWWAKNGHAKSNLYRQHYKTKHPVKQWATSCINSHKARGFAVKFTSSELEKLALTTIVCSICKNEINWNPENRKIHSLDSPSVDRINNGTILSLDNIAIVCYSCNTTKQSRTMPEFIEYCKKIVELYT